MEGPIHQISMSIVQTAQQIVQTRSPMSQIERGIRQM